MATRDFKIRSGLTVQGDFTLGGNTVSRLIDSDEVVNIINSNVTGLADSDLKAIADLRNDVDSDSIAIQAIQTDLETAESNITTIQSDISTINAKLDSDSIKIQVLQGEVDALTAGTYNDAPLVARLDSDEIAIQSLGTSLSTLDSKVNSIEADLDSETSRIQLLLLATDSDSLSIAGLRIEADSDAAAIAELLRQADSDATAIQALRTELTSDIDAINVRLDSDEIAIQAVRNDMDISFNVANNGASAYTFTGDGFPSGVDNPTLYLERGHTYNFRVNASGHPFEIRQASGGAAYSTGVTNNAAQVGLVTFVVPMDAPDTLVYQCTAHSGMVGTIKIGKAGYDSDQIVGIINENVVTDPTINTRLDSDEIKIQALGTSIESLNATLTGLSGSAAIQTVVYTFTAIQGQTAFTGTDDNGLTLSYAPGYIYVFVNGVLVLDTTDYTATDGSTVNIVEALDSDNTVQIIKHVGTVQTGFDSDQVVAIINENVVTDPTINTRLDSDEAKIQAIQTTVDNLVTVSLADSDIVVLTGAKSLATNQINDGAVTDVDTFASTLYRSVKYVVVASSDSDSTYQADEILVVHDGTTAYLTQYAQIATSDSELVTYDVTISSGNVVLQATPTRNNVRFDAQRLHVSVANNSIIEIELPLPDWSSSTESKIKSTDLQTGDQLGTSVGMSRGGEYAIVGAPYEDGGAGDPNSNAGAAYIFSRSGSTWTQQARLEASDKANSDGFGTWVAVNSDGTYAAVGAIRQDTNGADAGAVYIFTRSGSTWTQQAKIQSSDIQAGDHFGDCVSISDAGDYLLVGASQEDGGSGDPANNAGAAYVFTRSGSTWTQQARLEASDKQANDWFGASVAINNDGTYAIVGARLEDGGAGDPYGGAGAAYIFSRSGSTWTQQARLEASDIAGGDSFGYSVALNGDATYASVGANYEDGGAGDPVSGSGSVYIFSRSGSTWTEEAIVRASDAQANDVFGESVSLNTDGRILVVGASDEDGGAGDPLSASGAAYIFSRSGSTWTQEAIIRPSDVAASDDFGFVSSISGDGIYAIIGSRLDDDAGSISGAAYIYEAS